MRKKLPGVLLSSLISCISMCPKTHAYTRDGGEGKPFLLAGLANWPLQKYETHPTE